MTKQITLSQKKVALVDDEDFQNLSQWKWYASKDGNTFYAARNDRSLFSRKTIVMHRVIMSAPNELQVDHINGNGLDNRKLNLRLVTPHQNNLNKGRSKHNTSGYPGVSWHKGERKWQAYIQVNEKPIFLGKFVLKDDAIKARQEAELIYFGEFTRNQNSL